MSHWVTVFKKKLSKTAKNCPFLTVFVRFWQFLTVFDHFWPFFLKHSDSVWQTIFLLNTVTQCDKLFFFLNTVTQCDKHFFKHSDFFCGKFILGKKWKFWLPFNNKFQHRRKIGLEYLMGTLSCGYMGTLSCGYMVTSSCGYMGTLSCGCMVTWPCSYMVI